MYFEVTIQTPSRIKKFAFRNVTAATDFFRAAKRVGLSATCKAVTL